MAVAAHSLEIRELDPLELLEPVLPDQSLVRNGDRLELDKKRLLLDPVAVKALGVVATEPEGQITFPDLLSRLQDGEVFLAGWSPERQRRKLGSALEQIGAALGQLGASIWRDTIEEDEVSGRPVRLLALDRSATPRETTLSGDIHGGLLLKKKRMATKTKKKKLSRSTKPYKNSTKHNGASPSAYSNQTCRQIPRIL